MKERMEVLIRKLTPKRLKGSLSPSSRSKANRDGAGGKTHHVNKISKPKKAESFVALAEYPAQESGELSLLPGLVVEVLEKSDTGESVCVYQCVFVSV